VLAAILAGQQGPEQLAELSKGLFRNKIPELRLAFTDHPSLSAAATARPSEVHGVQSEIRNQKKTKKNARFSDFRFLISSSL
jgi:hypothetical protein